MGTAAGQYYHETMKEGLCREHKQLLSSPSGHQQGCNAENRDTICYKMSRKAWDYVNAQLMSTIFKCNNLTPHKLYTINIMGREKLEIIENIHFKPYYVMSQNMVSKAMCEKECKVILEKLRKQCHVCAKKLDCFW